ncbi:MAG: bifunctional oligoribonuclease/PAP phosphatase NrnA [Bacteroidales bacterium]|nr:bifunctional oligoribonuclease/PAP phosphatase NrnA [Bacteroidales bacterium]
MKILPPNDIKTLFRLISDAGLTVVAAHSHPDGDALGSCVAMVSWIRSRGLEAKAILPERCPDYLDFIVPESLAGDIIYYDTDQEAARRAIEACGLIVFQDMNRPDRAGDELGALLAASPVPKALIDHHPFPEPGFSPVFSETETSSTCELLHYILKEMPGVESARDLPPVTAAALMAGMTTDTNNFANSVFPTTLQMASELLEAGVDRDAIVSAVFNSYREERIRLMGRMLDNCLRITPDGVAYMILTQDVQEEFGMEEGDTEGFVNIPLTIGNVRMSIFLTEEDDRFRVSIRSKRGTYANRLSMKYFHGGGHDMAAGGKLMKPDDVLSADEAARYIETATHKFLSEDNDTK